MWADREDEMIEIAETALKPVFGLAAEAAAARALVARDGASVTWRGGSTRAADVDNGLCWVDAKRLTPTSASERRHGAGRWKMFRRDHKKFDPAAVDELALAEVPTGAVSAAIVGNQLRIVADLGMVKTHFLPVELMNAEVLEEDGLGAQVAWIPDHLLANE